jgi:hypothetical protein
MNASLRGARPAPSLSRLPALGLFSVLLAAVTTVLMAALLTGCSGNRSGLVDEWKDTEYPSRPMTKVLVVAVKKDATMRRVWEDGFVRELERHGVEAIPSYRLYPDRAPDEQQVLESIRSHGCDGMLVAHRLPTQTQERYVPGYLNERPVRLYNPWTGFYRTYWAQVYEPGYLETERLVRYQVEVWSVEDRGQLAWSGTTETIDPASSREVNREISDLIVPELARVGVIAEARS